MSDRTRKWMQGVAVAVGCLTGIGGMIGGFVLLPYRMDAVESRVEKLSQQREGDRELLLRIEERVIAVQKELSRPR